MRAGCGKMYFHHSDVVWERFPELKALVMVVRGVADLGRDRSLVRDAIADARRISNDAKEGGLPSIRAWRRAYASMGLEPTHCRCAAEALLRRLRKDGDLPHLDPLVDLLNAESARSAIPIAAFDVARVVDGIVVGPATGHEIHVTFRGDTEHPEPGEIVFADAAGQAHSRRWVFRQSAASVVSAASRVVLIVAEALHDTAEVDLRALRARLVDRAAALGLEVTEIALLDEDNRRFEFASAPR